VNPVSAFLALAAVLLAVGAVLCGMIVVLLARGLTRPPRMSDGKAAWVLKRLSPGDLGLPFEEISFDIRDAQSGEPLRIAGWWIPCPAARGRCVVLLHGYADAKVGAIAWAPTWYALGYNILAIDLRAHGESTGRQCTGGYLERYDVADVINQLRAQRPEQTQRLRLFGVSFGAAVAVATAAIRDDIDAVVLDSPVPDFAEGAMLQMEVLGAPRGLLRRWAVRLAERMTGAKFGEVRMLDLLPRLKCPVFVIAPQHDDLLAGGVRDALQDALRGHEANSLWTVGDAGHLGALHADPDEYRRRLEAFLS
jgi:uncharacterized protein